MDNVFIPRISSYNPTATRIGSTIRLELGPVSIFYSGEGIIAFSDDDRYVYSYNVFGSTGERHLKMIGSRDASLRLPRSEFVKALKAALLVHGITDANLYPPASQEN